MNEAAALGSALYSKLSGAGTAQGVNLYYALAPQGSVPAPYAIVQQQASVDDYAFGSYREVSADYVVKIVSDDEYPTGSYALYDLYDAALQDAALSVSGWSVLRVRRVSRIEYQDTRKFWHVGGLFRIDLVR